MRILIFGDSITQGFHDSEYGGSVNQLQAWTNKQILSSKDTYDCSIFNLGISGDCTNRLLKHFDSEIDVRLDVEDNTGVVIFALGINDTQYYNATEKIKTPLPQFGENLIELITRSKRYTSNIIFIGLLPILENLVQPMPWADDRSHFEKDRDIYDTKINEVAQKHNCQYISMNDVIEESDVRKMLHDGVHPNAEGHQLIFEKVKSELKKLEII